MTLKALSFLEDKEFVRKLLRISAPVTMQSLMLALVAASDAFMLGHTEQNAMAAVSLATQIQFVQNMVIGGSIATASILGAQYWGKRDTESLNKIFALTLKISGLVSLIFSLACVLFPKLLMAIFTNDADLISIGSGYLSIAGWSYFLTGISQAYLSIMKVSEHTSLTAIISSCTVVFNIIANAVLIFGLFGFPALGAKGAAIATLSSRIIELLWCVCVSYKKTFIHPHIRNFFKTDRLLARDYLKCMLPLLGASVFWGVGFTSYSAFMGHIGKDAAAANSVVSVIRDLVCCMCNGLATGAGIVVGNELGAGNLKKGRLYGDRLFVISFICGFISTAIMLSVTPLVFGFVSLTKEAEQLLLGMMLIMAFYMIGRAVNSILINGIFDCGGDTLFDMYSLAICMWCLAIPLAALGTFVFHWNPLIVYACTCLDELGKIPWVIVHYRKYKWVKDLTR